MLIKKLCMHMLKMNKCNITKWTPGKYIDTNCLNKSIAVILLNRPIHVPRQLFINLWNNAELRLVVDGGGNRWVKFVNNIKNEKVETPHILSGDFDSITDENMQYLKKLNCDIIHTPDQNETDFTKSLHILKSKIVDKNVPISTILVITESSGRLDHIMANINTLFKHANILSNIPVIIMTSNSLCWLLSPGNHEIDIPSTLVENETWCALVPVGNECIVSTKGLKWNLDNHKLSFGELVSTSNTYDGAKTVHILTNNYLLWTMGILKDE